MGELARTNSSELSRLVLSNAISAVLAEHERELATPFCVEMQTSYSMERAESTFFGLIRFKSQYGFTIRSKNG